LGTRRARDDMVADSVRSGCGGDSGGNSAGLSPMTYDDWKTTDPGAEFLGDAEQEEDGDE
jgi:hypothetical protein